MTSRLTEKIQSFDHPAGRALEALTRFHGLDHENPEAGHFKPLENTKAYEDGLAEGRAHALSQAQDNAQNIARILNELGVARQQIEASHERALSGILRAALPALAQRNALMEIKDFIVKITAQALSGRVDLYASPHMQEHLKAAIQGTATAGASGPEFNIKIDKKISGPEICASWQGGGAKIDIGAAVQECLALLETGEKGDEDGERLEKTAS